MSTTIPKGLVLLAARGLVHEMCAEVLAIGERVKLPAADRKKLSAATERIRAKLLKRIGQIERGVKPRKPGT